MQQRNITWHLCRFSVSRPSKSQGIFLSWCCSFLSFLVSIANRSEPLQIVVSNCCKPLFQAVATVANRCFKPLRTVANHCEPSRAVAYRCKPFQIVASLICGACGAHTLYDPSSDQKCGSRRPVGIPSA